MIYREFLDFRTDSGKSAVREWLAGLSDKQAREDILAQIDSLQRQRIPHRSDYQQLARQKGISEIRVKCGGRGYRIFCCQGPLRHQVTMLVGVVKEGWTEAWKTEIAVAVKRKRVVDLDSGRAHGFRTD